MQIELIFVSIARGVERPRCTQVMHLQCSRVVWVRSTLPTTTFIRSFSTMLTAHACILYSRNQLHKCIMLRGKNTTQSVCKYKILRANFHPIDWFLSSISLRVCQRQTTNHFNTCINANCTDSKREKLYAYLMYDWICFVTLLKLYSCQWIISRRVS